MTGGPNGPSRHEHDDLMRRVTALEARVDLYENRLTDRYDAITDKLATLVSRLSWLIGAASIAGTGLALLAGALIYHVTHGG